VPVRDGMNKLEAEVARLDPACFALVMATGIVSNGFYVENWRGLSDAMLAFNLLAFGWLILLTLIRAALFAPKFIAEGLCELRPGGRIQGENRCPIGQRSGPRRSQGKKV